MIQIAKPLKSILEKSTYAATTYDRRHIAEPIFEDQLRGYGVHLLAKPAGSSDDSFYHILRENGVSILVAPPLDHLAKGQGIPGALKTVADQLKLVLMSSATPTEDTLRTLAQNDIAVDFYLVLRTDTQGFENIRIGDPFAHEIKHSVRWKFDADTQGKGGGIVLHLL